MARQIKFATADFIIITDEKEKASIGAWSLTTNKNETLIGYSIETFVVNIKDVGPIYIQDLNLISSYIIHFLDNCNIPYIRTKDTYERVNYDFYNAIVDASGTVYKILFQINGKRIEIRNSRLKLVNSLNGLTNELFGYEVKDDKTIQSNKLNESDLQAICKYSESLFNVLGWYLKFGRQLTISGDVIKEWQRLDSEKALLYENIKLPDKVEFDIRQSYRGGVCWTDPNVIDVDLGHGYVIDMHSIYLYVQYNFSMPYGIPKLITSDEWLTDEDSYYVGKWLVSAQLKKGGFPCMSCCDGINSTSNNSLYEINDAVIFMNKYDLELLYKNYDVTRCNFEYGYKFNTVDGLFDNFINKWWTNKSKNNKKKALRAIAKAFAVNSYGKFGLKPKIEYVRKDGRWMPLGEDGKVILNKSGFSYVPVAACITSIARWLIINYAMKCRDEGGDGRVVAIDTDAVHWIGEQPPKFFNKSEELGEFDIEAEFNIIRHLGIKQYGYIKLDGTEKYVLAGANDKVKENITWDIFHIGEKVYGKACKKMLSQGAIRHYIKYTFSGGI